MAEIDVNNLSLEVEAKYSVENNAFKLDEVKNATLDTYTGEPKDEINIFVGDDKQPDKFYPQVKLERWSNETNFSLRLIDNEIGTEAVSTDKDKIIWEKGNIKIEYYDYLNEEGGYKMVWYLKEKPDSNKLEFTIQSKDLDFFYQPELTQEEIERGCVRPENVVGSYAVYHSTKGGMNDVNGKDYKAGIAFHIYRPRIIDAEGKETWGILHIENGIYSVEIPQDFLDNAVYPIKSNDDFGYKTKGGSLEGMYQVIGSVFVGAAGTANSMTAALLENFGMTQNVKTAIYLHSNSSRTGVTTQVEVPFYTNNWINFDFATEPTLSAVDYVLVGWCSATTMNMWYNSGDSNQGHQDSDTIYNYNGFPDPADFDTHNTNKYSIYVTYTPSGGPAVAKGGMPNFLP